MVWGEITAFEGARSGGGAELTERRAFPADFGAGRGYHPPMVFGASKTGGSGSGRGWGARGPWGAVGPLVLATVVASGCAYEDPSTSLPEAEGEDDGIGTISQALTSSDPLSAAVTQACSTAVARGLGEQLVAEVQCLRPGTFSRIDALPNVTLGSAVFPFLQPGAATALAKVATARRTPLAVNSALRTLPQQYLLYQWYLKGRCGISLAAKPGRSNHESALAVDVEDSAGWRTAFTANSWRWLGSSDPVHYDYTAAGVDIRGLSVLAFQHLWNINHPEDRLTEDGAYGAETEKRLAKTPIGGFPKGADCAADGGARDAGADGGAKSDAANPYEPPPIGPNGLEAEPDAAEPLEEAGDCSCHLGAIAGSAGLGLPFAVALAFVLVARRRTAQHRLARPGDRGADGVAREVGDGEASSEHQGSKRHLP